MPLSGSIGFICCAYYCAIFFCLSSQGYLRFSKFEVEIQFFNPVVYNLFLNLVHCSC
eukprot:TRINITY_DN3278_c1_g5_i1.p1 TRINITY_DN3278_c1_g5~~TRINITY_DN3278_c1_g5_i1.p1  ORF type:complete len:66 (-),score=10.11 TRINITY_DN3278_c1_g5_i1:327-497(-)